jgi:lysozyme
MLRTKLAKSLTNTKFGALSDKLFNFIGGLESFTPVAEWDFKQWSVGYGSGFNWDKNRPVQKGDIIDKTTAKRWLLLEAQQNFDKVMQMVKVPINDNQLIALSSFAYNVGNGALNDSTLLKLLNSNADKNIVAAQFDKWVYAGGAISKGLKNRRSAEKKLFLS